MMSLPRRLSRRASPKAMLSAEIAQNPRYPMPLRLTTRLPDVKVEHGTAASLMNQFARRITVAEDRSARADLAAFAEAKYQCGAYVGQGGVAQWFDHHDRSGAGCAIGEKAAMPGCAAERMALASQLTAPATVRPFLQEYARRNLPYRLNNLAQMAFCTRLFGGSNTRFGAACGGIVMPPNWKVPIDSATKPKLVGPLVSSGEP